MVTNNYHQTINKTIIADKEDADEAIGRGNTFIALGEKDKAIEAFQKATDIAPGNYLTWLGVAAAMTEDFKIFADARAVEYLEKAVKVAPSEKRDEVRALAEQARLEILRYNRIIAEAADSIKIKSGEVITEGDFCFQQNILVEYKGSDGNVIIPPTYSAVTRAVTAIGDDAFGGNTNIHTICIPSSVNYIGNRAFNMCQGIAVFEMPATVLYLGKNVFAGWTKKQKIVISRAQVKLFKKSNKVTRGKWRGNCRAKVVIR